MALPHNAIIVAELCPFFVVGVIVIGCCLICVVACRVQSLQCQRVCDVAFGIAGRGYFVVGPFSLCIIFTQCPLPQC